jgi:Family of unknown function (DUF6166)
MKTYRGRRHGSAVDVTVDGRPLNPRLDLWNHSPNGFEWGYGGSGPAQLALALLADHFGNGEQALQVYQSFKWQVVSALPHLEWTLTSRDIEAALRNLGITV